MASRTVGAPVYLPERCVYETRTTTQSVVVFRNATSRRSIAGAPISAGFASNRRTPSRRASVVVRADYYDALGVGKSASKKEIKSAYRQQARKFHPDVNKEAGAEEKFKKISEACVLLLFQAIEHRIVLCAAV